MLFVMSNEETYTEVSEVVKEEHLTWQRMSVTSALLVRRQKKVELVVGVSNVCCSFKSPPWFYKQLLQLTTEFLSLL